MDSSAGTLGEVSSPGRGAAAQPAVAVAHQTEPQTPTPREALAPPMPAGGWRGWSGPLAAVGIAAALRLPWLGRPNELVFDETYYAKDALSLLRFGSEQQMVDDANAIILNSDGNVSTLEVFAGEPSYVVHPPLGKWIIAAGEWLFGMTPFGWRVGMLVVGLVAVLVVARAARRLLRSNLWGAVAGLLMAVDGMAIVLSRTALLDNALMLFTVAAFAALLVDRDRSRARVAALLPADWSPSQPVAVARAALDQLPAVRTWRVAAAVLLGLACAVKWSGLWYAAAFGVLTVLWGLGLRRSLGVRAPWSVTFLRDAIPTAAMWVAVILTVYLTSWTGWLLGDSGYNRDWAAQNPSEIPGVLDPLRSLWHYHAEALSFHTGLTSEHSYAADALAWPVLARPTAFYYSDAASCGAPNCAEEVLALGNPLIWWGAVLAMIFLLWRWAARRDWRAGAVLAGFLAGWAPWLLYGDRPIFAFYSIVFLPYLVLALTIALAAVANIAGHRRAGSVAVIGFLLLVIAVSAFFYPIWVGEPLPYEQWRWRMWFPSWI